MSINHGSKNTELSDTLVTFLGKNISLAHIKLISLFVVALCKAKTVCFSLLSTVFESPAKSSSCLRRIQRFFAEFDLDRDLIARVIFRYGLDILTEFLLRGRNEYKIPIFNFSAIVNQILTPD